MSAKAEVSKQSTEPSSSKLEKNVGKTQPAGETTSVFTEHESQSNWGVVVGARNSSREDKQDEEA